MVWGSIAQREGGGGGGRSGQLDMHQGKTISIVSLYYSSDSKRERERERGVRVSREREREIRWSQLLWSPAKVASWIRQPGMRLSKRKSLYLIAKTDGIVLQFTVHLTRHRTRGK